MLRDRRLEKSVVDVRVVEAVADHHDPRCAHAEVALELGEIPFEHLVRLNGVKLPRFRRVVLDLGDYGSLVTASIAAS